MTVYDINAWSLDRYQCFKERSSISAIVSILMEKQ